MSRRYVEITYDGFLKETDKAALLLIDGDEVWLPFSHMEDGQELIEEGGTLSVTQWIAEKNSLEFDEL